MPSFFFFCELGCSVIHSVRYPINTQKCFNISKGILNCGKPKCKIRQSPVHYMSLGSGLDHKVRPQNIQELDIQKGTFAGSSHVLCL